MGLRLFTLLAITLLFSTKAYAHVEEVKVSSDILIAILFFTALMSMIVIFLGKKRLSREIDNHKKTIKTLQRNKRDLQNYKLQMEQFSLSAATMLSIGDETILFDRISKAIVEYSDFERVLISLFHDDPPARELIGHCGVEMELVEKVKSINLDKSWYDSVFSDGIRLGQASYYIPHSMKHILNKEATIFGEGDMVEKEGGWHPEDNLFVRMKDENGKFIGVISVDNSKCGRKPTNDTVRPLELYASLISQIIILKRAQIQKKTLEGKLLQAQKMEAIGNLTGGIAHDFNNVLGVIVGHVEMALRIQPENPAYLEHVNEIKRASNRARDIVQHLLTFSRKKEKELRTIQIKDTLADSIKFLRSIIPSTIEIVVDLQLDECSVMADPTQILQIILNLGTNAVHAMEDTGGQLQVSAKKVGRESLKDLSSKPMTAAQYVKISVQDTGHGIGKDDLDMIFDPYFTTKDVGKGTGMGLAVVHGIVESHEGTIKVTSWVGEGCLFDIYIPVHQGETQLKKASGKEMPGGSERILLVDDEAGLLMVMKRQLERKGYSVDAYEDSVEAFDMFRMEPDAFNLVIADVTMPKMSGDVLTKKILEIRPDMPVFLNTGFSEKMDEEQSKNVGARRFFLKPLAFPVLSAAIREELDK